MNESSFASYLPSGVTPLAAIESNTRTSFHDDQLDIGCIVSEWSSAAAWSFSGFNPIAVVSTIDDSASTNAGMKREPAEDPMETAVVPSEVSAINQCPLCAQSGDGTVLLQHGSIAVLLHTCMPCDQQWLVIAPMQERGVTDRP